MNGGPRLNDPDDRWRARPWSNSRIVVPAYGSTVKTVQNGRVTYQNTQPVITLQGSVKRSWRCQRKRFIDSLQPGFYDKMQAWVDEANRLGPTEFSK